MERTPAVSLGDILRQTIEETELSRQLDESRAIQAWPVVIGARIAARSPRPEVRRGVMTVRVYDAGLRQELHMMRSSIARALNKVVGKEVITDIRFR